tara:strand:+ start:5633 stop:6634 length:1002 start_codon:yes stop_codon:yes gene_type:complete
MVFLKKTAFFFCLLVFALLAQNPDDVIYVKYFESDHNFKADLAMLSTERRGKAHLAVSYNTLNQPIKIERISPNGVTKKLEMLRYDLTGKMIERGEYNQNMKYLNLTVYGQDEMWSQEYRTWRYKVNEPLNFNDQQTYFIFDDGMQVKKIIFQTIDGQKYGQIELDYDYLGYLSEERWRDLPSARIIRRFKYKFDIIYHDEEPSTVVQIWEFGHDGELISSVAVDMAPADQLYLTPPPRTHNTLDEVDIIAKEIKESRILVPQGGFIPKTEWDILLLVNGEQLFVDYFSVSDNGIQFRMDNEDELLTLPLHRVRSLTSRMGDVIYPKPIHLNR